MDETLTCIIIDTYADGGARECCVQQENGFAFFPLWSVEWGYNIERTTVEYSNKILFDSALFARF